MLYFLKYILSLFFIVDISTEFSHVLDRSTVKDGDKLLITCNWDVASGGQPISNDIQVMTIFKKSPNESLETIIISCNHVDRRIIENNLTRAWIIRGIETCTPNVSVAMRFSVEIADSKCIDAGVYGCRSITKDSIGKLPSITFEVAEELKRDASCVNMERTTPAGDSIKTTKTSSAHQETSLMVWPLVVGAIIMFGMLAK